MTYDVGIKGFIEALGAGDEDGVDKLRDVSNGCPACMLAAIRQSSLQCPPDEDGQGFSVPFNYEEEKARFWSEINEKDLADEWAHMG